MIWSDLKIKDNAEIITPFNLKNVQPNSYDVTLGNDIMVETENGWVKRNLPYKLKKGEFVLGTTLERVNVPNGIVCQLEGKSTNARKGLCVHITAGYIDSGFNGNITLEMVNHSIHDFELINGMRIGQLVFFDGYQSQHIYGECGNHYQGQKGVTPAYSAVSEKLFERNKGYRESQTDSYKHHCILESDLNQLRKQMYLEQLVNVKYAYQNVVDAISDFEHNGNFVDVILTLTEAEKERIKFERMM